MDTIVAVILLYTDCIMQLRFVALLEGVLSIERNRKNELQFEILRKKNIFLH